MYKEKTKDECLRFWREIKTKLLNNEYNPGSGDFQFINYTDDEKLAYCEKMIDRINNPKPKNEGN